jgi:hypothetical protein
MKKGQATKCSPCRIYSNARLPNVLRKYGAPATDPHLLTAANMGHLRDVRGSWVREAVVCFAYV